MRPVTSGILLRLLTALLGTVMSLCVHEAARSLPVGQVMFWRSALGLLPILGWAAWQGHSAWRTKRPLLHATRSLLGALTMALSFLSLAWLPLGTAQALAFLAPVFTLPLAALMLGERLTGRLLTAIALGLAGVPLILGAALQMPGQGALIGVIAGLAYALTMAFLRVFSKRMVATETPTAIAFWFAITAALAGLATWPLGWSPVDTPTALFLAGAGLFGGLTHIAANEAIARAPVSTLAPIDFTALVWAMLFDALLLGHLPGPMALIGTLTITAAALLTTRPARAPLAPPEPRR